MSYYRKFKDFFGKMQTNKLPVWHSSALPKNGLIILSFFEFECAAGRLQSHFLLPNASEKVCSCVYSIDRQGRS